MLNPLGNNGPYVKTPWFRKVKSSFHVYKRAITTLCFMIFAIGILTLSYGEFALLQDIRLRAMDFFAPVVDIARVPGVSLEKMRDNVKAFYHQSDKLQQLKAENQRLQGEQVLVHQIQQENTELKAILKIPQDKYKIVAYARVLAYSGTPYVKSLLLGIGKQQGLAPLQAVITPEGLVGRITDVGETSARVIMITDLNAHIPVVIKPGNVHAILTGNNTDTPRLKYIKEVSGPIGVGDRVETCPSSGIFPPGIPVGTVKKIDKEHVLIRPAMDLENLNFVTVVKLNEVVEIPGGES